MPDHTADWLPADLERRLLDPEEGPAIRELFAIAKTSREHLMELHPHEQWRFVIGCFDAFQGPPADPCCCCSRSTVEGRNRLNTTEAQWLKAVKATVRNHPDWVW